MADTNTTQDNLQNIMVSFDGTMAMIATAAKVYGGPAGDVFAASFSVMNGTITGVISFEGSSETRSELEKACVGALVGTFAGGAVVTGLIAAGATAPVVVVGAGAMAIATGLTGEAQYAAYLQAQKAFFKWMITNNIELPQSINEFFNAAQNWTPPRRDPLVLDLDGDGIETLGITSTTQILFDYDGDGVKTGTGWIAGDDGFVVLDRNGNGTIDNGGELFGDQTLVNGVKATDGFAALSAQNSNNNGQFDAGDTNFTNVRIWQDTNSDGISQAGELHTLSELGITSINLDSTTTAKTSNGNVQTAIGTFTKTNGTIGDSGTLELDDGTASNLNFSQNPFYSEFTDHLTLSDTALALPDMQGSGMVRDLREASTLSAELTSALQTMSTTYETHDEMMAQIDTLLSQWASTSSMATSTQQAEANEE